MVYAHRHEMELIQRQRVFLEILMVPQLTKVLPTFIKPDDTSPCSQKFSVGPYTVKSNSHPHTFL